jgi:hypothetical protein
MAISSNQIGNDPQSKLLWNIWKQLEQLLGVASKIIGPPGPQGPEGPMGSLADAYHGSFYSIVDQSTTANTPKAMEYEVTELSSGVSIVNDLSAKPTRITFTNAGVYNVQFSVQFHNTDGGGSAAHTHVWLSKNGTTVANTNSRVSVTPNSPYVISAWNFFVDASAADYVELIWEPSITGIIIEHEPLGAVPLIPSVILTVNRIA